MIDFYIDLFSCDLFFEFWTRSYLNFAGAGFYVYARLTNEMFHSFGDPFHSSGKVCLRNYKGRWHVLSTNQSRASNRTGIRHYQGLRKAFRAAVTFWVAIVKRKKESWTVGGWTWKRVETTHEQEGLNGTGKWKRNGNNRGQRKNKTKRRKKSRRRRKKCGLADIMECSD